jgi:hypothetical protein
VSGWWNKQADIIFLTTIVHPHTNPFIREQDLQNYLLKKDYLNAILLAMSLEQPFRLLNLFDTVLNERPEGDKSITGSSAIDKILQDMTPEQINKLLGYIRDWNTNAKRSRVAQTILNALLTLHSSEELVELSNAKEVRTQGDIKNDLCKTTLTFCSMLCHNRSSTVCYPIPSVTISV